MAKKILILAARFGFLLFLVVLGAQTVYAAKSSSSVDKPSAKSSTAQQETRTTATAATTTTLPARATGVDAFRPASAITSQWQSLINPPTSTISFNSVFKPNDAIFGSQTSAQSTTYATDYIINIQGKITPTAGLSSPVDMDFYIYDDPNAANNAYLFHAIQSIAVDASTGVFNTKLPPAAYRTLDFKKQYYLGIFYKGAWLSRQLLTAAPYAIHSNYATTAETAVLKSGDTMTGQLYINAPSMLNALVVTGGHIGGSFTVDEAKLSRTDTKSRSGAYALLTTGTRVTAEGGLGVSQYINNDLVGKYGVYGSSDNHVGVYGVSLNGTGVQGAGNVGVSGLSNTGPAIWGNSTATVATANGGGVGVYGSGLIGVYGRGGPNGAGIMGAGSGVGVFAQTTAIDNYAGSFSNSHGKDYPAIYTTGYINADGDIRTSGNMGVSGSIVARGVISAKEYVTPNADIAEWVKVTDNTISAGDVLVIDPEENESLKKCDQANSTLVSGIVSTNPGFVGSYYIKDRKEKINLTNEEMEKAGYRKLSLVGRVPCNVCDENGPIERGDLLTTSSIPGFAMKVTDKMKAMGAIVGKALEPLKSGKGQIIVLVTLQ